MILAFLIHMLSTCSLMVLRCFEEVRRGVTFGGGIGEHEERKRDSSRQIWKNVFLLIHRRALNRDLNSVSNHR